MTQAVTCDRRLYSTFHSYQKSMPSTRRQTAKARRLTKIEILSDHENMDVMLGGNNSITPIQQKTINGSVSQGDSGTNSNNREKLIARK